MNYEALVTPSKAYNLDTFLLIASVALLPFPLMSAHEEEEVRSKGLRARVIRSS